MSYDPTAPTEGERSNAYFQIWVGAIGSATLLFAHIVDVPRAIATVAALAVAISFVVAILSPRNDDYFRHLVQIASQTAMAIIALWFCFAAVIEIGNGGNLLGQLAAGVKPSPMALSKVEHWIRAEAVILIAAMAFHIRFLIARYIG